MIRLRGVRERNLRGLDLDLPIRGLTAFVGPSGSGKSTLLFDVVHAEARRRFLSLLDPAWAASLQGMPRAELDVAEGLPPTLAVRGRSAAAGSVSTVITMLDVADAWRRLFVALGEAHCPRCARPLPFGSAPEHADRLLATAEERRVALLAPPRGGESPAEAFLRWRAAGYLRVWCAGEARPLEETRPAEGALLVVDRLRLRRQSRSRLLEALQNAFELAEGRALWVVHAPGEEPSSPRPLALLPWCEACGERLPAPSSALFSPRAPQGRCEACEGRGRREREDATGYWVACAECAGSGLGAQARAWRLAGRPPERWLAAHASEALSWLEELRSGMDPARLAPIRPLLEHLMPPLRLLGRLGLGYLQLGRPFDSLSSGERRRVRLAAQLATPMPGVLYLLDEPFEGLHPRDVPSLLQVLRGLLESGAGVWVAGHEPLLIEAADEVLELGPGAGAAGGELVARGSPRALRQQGEGTVGRWLRGEVPLPDRSERRARHWARLRGVSVHNLQGLDLELPLGALTVLIGPSGSGKSTLLFDVLEPAAAGRAVPAEAVEGFEGFSEVLRLDGEPLRGGRRGNPATYTGAFDGIRAHFAALPEARMRGWGPRRFSFNVPGGRCERCRGEGEVEVEAAWPGAERVPCPRCRGKRYEEETLRVRWRGLSIADVLAATVDEALQWFEEVPAVRRPLEALARVGLGHLPLGRPSSSLSAGEGRRLRLARLLAKRRRSGKALVLLDEPSTGLHPRDVDRLLGVFDALLEAGHSVVVADHRLRLAAVADHLIELGPGGGPSGGRLLASGTPRALARGESPSARWLAGWLGMEGGQRGSDAGP